MVHIVYLIAYIVNNCSYMVAIDCLTIMLHSIKNILYIDNIHCKTGVYYTEDILHHT